MEDPDVAFALARPTTTGWRTAKQPDRLFVAAMIPAAEYDYTVAELRRMPRSPLSRRLSAPVLEDATSPIRTTRAELGD